MLCGSPSADTPPTLTSPDGRVCWNQAKDYQYWAWIRGLNGFGAFPTLALNPIAPSRAQIITHTVSPEGPDGGDIEVCALFGSFRVADVLTPRASVLLSDSRTKRQYMNAPVVSTHVYGSMLLPGGLPAPIYVPATQTLQAQIVNLEALDMEAKTSIYGRRFLGGPNARAIEARQRAAFFSQRIHPYWLTSDTGAEVVCPANGSVTIRCTVPSSAYFEAFWLLDDSTANYDVQIFIGSEMRSFMDGPLPRSHVFTTLLNGSSIGYAPLRYCPWTQGLAPNTPLTFVITDTSGADNDIRISTLGRVIYVNSAHTPVLDAALRDVPVFPGPYATPSGQTCTPCDPQDVGQGFVPGRDYLSSQYQQGAQGPIGVVSPGGAPVGFVPLTTPPLPQQPQAPWSPPPLVLGGNVYGQQPQAPGQYMPAGYGAAGPMPQGLSGPPSMDPRRYAAMQRAAFLRQQQAQQWSPSPGGIGPDGITPSGSAGYLLGPG